MPRAAMSSPIARASGTDRASRSSFRDDEGVAAADGGEFLVEPGAVAVGAGESVVEVDAPLGDAEVAEAVALGREGLVVGGAAGVADQRAGHPENVTDSPRALIIHSYHLCETLLVAAAAALRLSAAVSVWGSAYGQPSARWRAELSRGVLALSPAREARSPVRQSSCSAPSSSAVTRPDRV